MTLLTALVSDGTLAAPNPDELWRRLEGVLDFLHSEPRLSRWISCVGGRRAHQDVQVIAAAAAFGSHGRQRVTGGAAV